jgi:hypothetical protein
MAVVAASPAKAGVQPTVGSSGVTNGTLMDVFTGRCSSSFLWLLV